MTKNKITFCEVKHIPIVLQTANNSSLLFGDKGGKHN